MSSTIYRQILQETFDNNTMENLLDVINTYTITLCTKSGINCFMCAAKWGHLEIFKDFVTLNAYLLHEKDENELTALDYARKFNHLNIEYYILSCIPEEFGGTGEDLTKTCEHPIEHILIEDGAMICTNCALVLEKKLPLPEDEEEYYDYLSSIGVNNQMAKQLGYMKSLGYRRTQTLIKFKERRIRRIKAKELSVLATTFVKMELDINRPCGPIYPYC